MKVIDETDKSNKLLAELAVELSRISANVCQALMVWQELVALEEKLKYYHDQESEGFGDISTQEQIAILSAECKEKACELKRWYITINQEFDVGTQPTSILFLVSKRLDSDYISTFESEGIA